MVGGERLGRVSRSVEGRERGTKEGKRDVVCNFFFVFLWRGREFG